MRTDIRVDVRFKNAAVYAGEDLACIITFRNIARPPPTRNDSTAATSIAARPKLNASASLPPRTLSTATAGTRPSIASIQSPVIEHGRRQSTLSVSMGPNILAHARTRSSASGLPQMPGVPTSDSHRRSSSAASIRSSTLTPISPSFPSSRRPSRVWRTQSTDRSLQDSQETPVSPSFRPRHGSTAPVVSSPTRPSHGGSRETDASRPTTSRISPRSSTDNLSRRNDSRDSSLLERQDTVRGSPPPLKKSHGGNDPVSSRLPALHEPEHLMMAYAQTTGSFTLDGSLVDQAPFEQVKQQDIMTRGGVVGIEGQKAPSNFFGTFGWSTLGDIGLGAVLGKDEKSSIKDLKSALDQKAIPLLSTPQSLLFVDLRLAPGERKSCAYTFRIPRGLPPSHKGRAIKVNYQLKIGVQRPGELKGRKQTTTVDIPFRVLGSVNDDGETLGHDLAAPHVLREDLARTQDRTSPTSPTTEFLSTVPLLRTDRASFDSGLADFTAYTQRLLESRTLREGLSSPSVSRKQSRQFTASVHATMRERIDEAIARSNTNHSLSPASPDGIKAGRATNRFVIFKDERYIGQISLLRPAYRLGESVLGTIDFSPPAGEASASGSRSARPRRRQKTYIATLSLETTETIDASLAQRSKQSIARATRKVFATSILPCLYARSVGFELELPTTATPGFLTSGVALEWRLRVAFSTGPSPSPSASAPERTADVPHALLREQAPDVTDGLLRGDGASCTSESEEGDPVADADADADATADATADVTADTDAGAHTYPDSTVTTQSRQTHPTDHDESVPGPKVDHVTKSAAARHRDRILIAEDILETEVFEILIPLRIYGVPVAGSSRDQGGLVARDLSI